MIDLIGLRGFRRDKRTLNDPDETEGRAIYRAQADAEGRRSIGLARQRSIRDDR